MESDKLQILKGRQTGMFNKTHHYDSDHVNEGGNFKGVANLGFRKFYSKVNKYIIFVLILI